MFSSLLILPLACKEGEFIKRIKLLLAQYCYYGRLHCRFIFIHIELRLHCIYREEEQFLITDNAERDRSIEARLPGSPKI